MSLCRVVAAAFSVLSPRKAGTTAEDSKAPKYYFVFFSRISPVNRSNR